MATRQDRAVIDAARQKASERRQLFARTDRRFNRPSVSLLLHGELRSETDRLVKEFLDHGGRVVRVDAA